MPLIILNFHGVGPLLRDIDEGEHHCWLDQDFFEAVLELIRDQPHVRLTVDDGNASDAAIILPALRRRGLQALFFICSGRLDQPTFLSQSQVCELHAQGMGIGSHGVAHRSWRHLASGPLQEELAGSKVALEKVCGAPIDYAACPFGAYDRTVLKGLRQAGYRAAYTSDGGWAKEEQWLRARTTVTRTTQLADLQRLIRQGPGRWRQASISARHWVKRLRS